jgi:DNA-binding response OmpR family regulator
MKSEKPKILIADADTYIQSLLEVVFPARDYAVTAIIDGLDAAAHLKTDTPDVVIVDAELPTLDGIDLCGRIKRIKRLQDCIVVVLTPAADQRLADSARIARADAVVTKPLSAQAFKTMVTDLLRRRAVSPAEDFVRA